MSVNQLNRSLFRLGKTYLHFSNTRRYCHSQNLKENNAIDLKDSMSAWQIISYGDEKNLQFCPHVEVPMIEDPDHVLIKVAAASVNPLDVEMMRGFGSVLLKNLRQIETLNQSNASELPLILGRDFAGEIVAKGLAVSNFEIGDNVYGVVKPQNQGCHAEYAVTSAKLLARKPDFISMEEASAILYTSLTAWNALAISGGLVISSPQNKRVLVIGSAGGVGNAAVQLLQAWGAKVIATCKTDAVTHVEKLSPEAVLDYTSPNYLSDVKSQGLYDIILDAAGLPEEELKQYTDFVNSCGSIVTLRSPLVANIDAHGLLCGFMKSTVDLILPNLTSGIFKNGSLIKWAFFAPFETAVTEIAKLVNERKILPAIENVYSYSQTPEAYQRMKAGHLRGKIVITMDDSKKETEKG